MKICEIKMGSQGHYHDTADGNTILTIIIQAAHHFKLFYPSADQRKPLGVKESNTQWFWCETISMHQRFLYFKLQYRQE